MVSVSKDSDPMPRTLFMSSCHKPLRLFIERLEREHLPAACPHIQMKTGEFGLKLHSSAVPFLVRENKRQTVEREARCC